MKNVIGIMRIVRSQSNLSAKFSNNPCTFLSIWSWFQWLVSYYFSSLYEAALQYLSSFTQIKKKNVYRFLAKLSFDSLTRINICLVLIGLKCHTLIGITIACDCPIYLFVCSMRINIRYYGRYWPTLLYYFYII